jgi:predicted unusual protein kinase regulating ubiquinone biosynthesis (AarF/ABC1/UbiB family)
MTVKSLTRIARYAGMARDAVQLRMTSDEAVRQRVRQHLSQRMGRLRGLPQKLGQMMSFSAMAEETSANPYETLCEDADPLPLDIIEKQLESAWGFPMRDIVEHIDERGRAASLGQVHRATLRDGRDVAIKVQYPGIRDAIQTDLKMLGWLSVPAGNLKRGFDLSAYRQAILEDLEDELDYRLEAKRQQEFSDWTHNNRFAIVANVVTELSADTVLVSDWEDGESWNEVRSSWDENSKRRLSNGLLSFFLQGLFVEGTMQADWHPGNVRFRRHGDSVQMVMYDLGCVYSPSRDQRLALVRLINATQTGDESPWPLFQKLGFDVELLEPLAGKLPALCRILFEPFCSDRPYDMSDWKLGERVGDVLGDDRWNFRIAGPANMVFLMRAFHGVKYYMEQMGTPVFWKRPFDSIASTLRGEWQQIELPPVQPDVCSFGTLARYLKMRVTENGRTKVELTQRAAGIDYLDSLLDADLKLRIEQQGHCVDDIVAGVRQRGYAAGPVFALEDESKQITVWLE